MRAAYIRAGIPEALDARKSASRDWARSNNSASNYSTFQYDLSDSFKQQPILGHGRSLEYL